MDNIRALSFKQPYADLIIYCNKIETRTWSTKYRGEVLICSSKARYNEAELQRISGRYLIHQMANTLAKSLPFIQAHETLRGNAAYQLQQYGKALAVATLVDVRPMQFFHTEYAFVKYDPKLYCHTYENVRPIKPFDWQGCQGWKTLTEEQKAKIVFL